MAKITPSLSEPSTVCTIPALNVRVRLVVPWCCLMVLHVVVILSSKLSFFTIESLHFIDMLFFHMLVKIVLA